ncbi:MAG: aminopeptidase [Chlorobiota bacterium]|nr:MAG: aminopeptidase [Chlorobiota bacterium]
MYDSRNKELADKIINYSTQTKEGDKVMVELQGINGIHLAQEMTRAILSKKAIPFIFVKDVEIDRMMRESGTTELWSSLRDNFGLPVMKEMDVYIGIRASENIYELSNASPESSKAYNQEYGHPVHTRERVNNTRWCVMRYPSPAFAMNAKMTSSQFADYYYKACLLDYSLLNERMKPLHELLSKTKEVHLVGEGTDIKIGIEGQNWVPCAGDLNIPDGEIFTSPIINQVNGCISYAPTVYDGKPFDDIRLVVKDGVIVDCKSNNQIALENILNTDEGSRRFGEFAIGTNPHIEKPMYDILFDEKIWGSIHLTPGQSYDIAPNGNHSAVHWDLVCIGSDLYFDDVLVRKGRKYVHPDLIPLNPENF